MHISIDNLRGSLSKQDSEHLKQCHQCQKNHQLMMQLMHDAENISLIKPSDSVWKKVQESQYENAKPRSSSRHSSWFYAGAVAAALAVMSVTLLSYNQIQLERQLSAALAVNQSLEMELKHNTEINYQQAELLEQLQQNAATIERVTSERQLLKQVTARQALFNQLLQLQKIDEEKAYEI